MGSDIVPDAELDCVGLYCPMPIAQTKQEIDKLEVGQVLKVEADDQAEGIDLLERSIHMDLMEMFIKVEDDVITDTKFKPFGCGSAIVMSSMVTELAKGMHVDKAMKRAMMSLLNLMACPHRRCNAQISRLMHFMRQSKTIKAKRNPEKEAVKSKEKIPDNVKKDKDSRSNAQGGRSGLCLCIQIPKLASQTSAGGVFPPFAPPAPPCKWPAADDPKNMVHTISEARL